MWLAQLDEKKGVDIGKTYRNRKGCVNFLNAIASIEREKIRNKFKDAEFFSIISDGSTDNSVVENEIVYVRFAVQGKIFVYFIGLMPVSIANAEGIYAVITQAISEIAKADAAEVLQKLIAFGSDGAAVNTGVKGGIITLLRKQVAASVLMVTCMAHRLELAYKEALKDIQCYVDVYTLLSNLYSFYHKLYMFTGEVQ